MSLLKTLSLPDFESATVLVAGDAMLDRYWHGDTSRISPEAPVPIVRVGSMEVRPGGAANVAVNVAALGSRPILLGITGDDEAAQELEDALAMYGVDARLERSDGYTTITKMRVLSRNQQLIRLDFETRTRATPAVTMAAPFETALAEADYVVLSDYGKGTLGDVPYYIERARAAGKPVLVDPKGTDFTPYRGATILTPNLPEFEVVVGACRDQNDLAERAERLRGALELEALVVTRGEEGMSLVRDGAPPVHLTAQAREVYDVTGAGDTAVAVLAAAIAAGADLPSAMNLANLGAGIVVAKLGTASVSVAELEQALRQGYGDASSGVLTEPELLNALAETRAAGNRVAMTNGCFDILHAGHVSYLARARALGDRLLVAVNDDTSVARLKGPSLPIVPLVDRMRVLAALSCVDWVVPFSEDTPERLIAEVRPELLVKGGDYRVNEIAGAGHVRSYGGRVEILPYLEGRSTTAIIETVQNMGTRSQASDE
jgi:D-beta-D-heptose 7-phosphate kinase/D-beta-D-heptose 1-phosphate adenosyltransferase